MITALKVLLTVINLIILGGVTGMSVYWALTGRPELAAAFAGCAMILFMSAVHLIASGICSTVIELKTALTNSANQPE